MTARTMRLGGDEEHLVLGLDQRVAFGDKRPIGAEDRRHAGIDLGHVGPEVFQLVPDQRPAVHGPDAGQLHLTRGEIEDLQGLGVGDELGDVLGDDLFGADGYIDREVVHAEDLGPIEKIGGADASDASRGMEQRGGELAGHEIDLVPARHRQEQLGIQCPGAFQHRGVRGIATQGDEVITVFQEFQARLVGIDDGDLGALRDQTLGYRRSDPSRPQDQNPHPSSPLATRIPGGGSAAARTVA
jgi:hypothetical protein